MLPGQDLPEDGLGIVCEERGLRREFWGRLGVLHPVALRFMTEAYPALRTARVTAPIRGATLVGSGPEVMNRISMVGNDLDLDGGVGVCGKDGQSVPVGVGQPTLKVDEIVVGGTATKRRRYDVGRQC